MSVPIFITLCDSSVLSIDMPISLPIIGMQDPTMHEPIMGTNELTMGLHEPIRMNRQWACMSLFSVRMNRKWIHMHR